MQVHTHKMRGKKYIYKFADKRREQVCLVHNTCARRRDLTLPKGSRNVFHCCGPIRLLVALCIDSATEHVHAGHLFSCPQILVLCLHFTPTLGFFSSLCIAPLILLCSSPISPLIPSSHLFPYLLSSLPFVSSFSSHLFSCSPPSPLISSLRLLLLLSSLLLFSSFSSHPILASLPFVSSFSSTLRVRPPPNAKKAANL